MKILAIIIGIGVIIGAAFLIYIHSGAYNVSAMVPHTELTLSVINTLVDNSIESHAEGIEAPDLSDSARIRAGYGDFDEMCVHCHGAPGIGRDDWAKGLYPEGPDLTEPAKEMSDAELFWIVKNGIKMTGMPSFGKTHDDDHIWNIVAFMKKLPDMSYYDYVGFSNSGSGHSEEGEAH